MSNYIGQENLYIYPVANRTATGLTFSNWLLEGNLASISRAFSSSDGFVITAGETDVYYPIKDKTSSQVRPSSEYFEFWIRGYLIKLKSSAFINLLETISTSGPAESETSYVKFTEETAADGRTFIKASLNIRSENFDTWRLGGKDGSPCDEESVTAELYLLEMITQADGTTKLYRIPEESRLHLPGLSVLKEKDTNTQITLNGAWIVAGTIDDGEIQPIEESPEPGGEEGVEEETPSTGTGEGGSSGESSGSGSGSSGGSSSGGESSGGGSGSSGGSSSGSGELVEAEDPNAGTGNTGNEGSEESGGAEGGSDGTGEVV